MFFLFKQKTAYEVRISDWSSDVCSSDLPHAYGLITMTRGAMNYFPPQMRKRQWVIPNPVHLPEEAKPYRAEGRTMAAVGRLVPQKGFDRLQIGRASCRERVCLYV